MATKSSKKGFWLWIIFSAAVLVLVLKAVGKLTTVTDKIKSLFGKKTTGTATTTTTK